MPFFYSQRKRSMSDETLQPVFQIQRVYLKDMSLGNRFDHLPRARSADHRSISRRGRRSHRRRHLRVDRLITVTAKIKDKVAFWLKASKLVSLKRATFCRSNRIRCWDRVRHRLPLPARNIADIITRRLPANAGRNQLRSVLPAAPSSSRSSRNAANTAALSGNAVSTGWAARPPTIPRGMPGPPRPGAIWHRRLGHCCRARWPRATTCCCGAATVAPWLRSMRRAKRLCAALRCRRCAWRLILMPPWRMRADPMR